MADDDDYEEQDMLDRLEYDLEHSDDTVEKTAEQVHSEQVSDLRMLNNGVTTYACPRVFNNLYYRAKSNMIGMEEAKAIFIKLFVKCCPQNSSMENQRLCESWFGHQGELPDEDFSIFEGKFPARVDFFAPAS